MPTNRESSISTHVLDHERGHPAAGFAVTLSRWEDGRLVHLATKLTNDDGRVDRFVTDELRGGVYQLAFDVAGYLHQQGRETPFLRTVVIDLQVADTARNYHVPLLLTPYSCTSYRGS